jgi:hypothetical protein
MLSLESLSAPELLRLHAATADELRRRGVVRSSNNPVGDLAEYLFCRAFGWGMAPKSAKAADAICSDGKLYQIKSRRITTHNPSRQLGVLRELDGAHFDFLAAILFAEDYTVLRVAIIPHASVLTGATYVARTNSWRFLLRDTVWEWPETRDVTSDLRAVQY